MRIFTKTCLLKNTITLSCIDGILVLLQVFDSLVQGFRQYQALVTLHKSLLVSNILKPDKPCVFTGPEIPVDPELTVIQ